MSLTQRWFWYASTPKLLALEEQSASWLSKMLGRLTLAFEFSYSKVKCSISSSSALSRSLTKRIDLADQLLMRSAIGANQIETVATARPLFFEFRGLAIGYVHEDFTFEENSAKIGGFGQGAFVVVGSSGETIVTLVGSAANTFPHKNPVGIEMPARISRLSEIPLAILNGQAVQLNVNGRLLSLQEALLKAVSEICHHAYVSAIQGKYVGLGNVRAIATFVDGVTLDASLEVLARDEIDKVSILLAELLREERRNATHYLVGSPVFVERLPY